MGEACYTILIVLIISRLVSLSLPRFGKFVSFELGLCHSDPQESINLKNRQILQNISITLVSTLRTLEMWRLRRTALQNFIRAPPLDKPLQRPSNLKVQAHSIHLVEDLFIFQAKSPSHRRTSPRHHLLCLYFQSSKLNDIKKQQGTREKILKFSNKIFKASIKTFSRKLEKETPLKRFFIFQ